MIVVNFSNAAVVLVDLLVLAIVLVAMARGSHVGIFRSLFEGLAVVAGVFLAMWISPDLARWLEMTGFYPRFALAVSFATFLAAPFLGVQYVVRVWPILQLVRFDSAIDRIGGAIVSIANGLLLAGALLLAWSVSPVPPSLFIDPATPYFDVGKYFLVNFVRCVEPDPVARELLLNGEPSGELANQTANAHQIFPQPSNGRLAFTSETFVDRNANGTPEPSEPYIDTDGNQTFSKRLNYIDVNGNGRRDVGLLERYSLGQWDRILSLTPRAEAAGTVDQRSAPETSASADD